MAATGEPIEAAVPGALAARWTDPESQAWGAAASHRSLREKSASRGGPRAALDREWPDGHVRHDHQPVLAWSSTRVIFVEDDIATTVRSLPQEPARLLQEPVGWRSGDA